MKIKGRLFGGVVALLIIAASSLMGIAHAQTGADAPFSLQVTPSPLVTTVKPGENKTLELRIRNAGTAPEELKAELRSFKLTEGNDSVQLLSDTPREVSDWVSFESPKFSVKPGEWFTERVKLNVPPQAGFSYSFAIVISRVHQVAQPSSTTLQGSVAVFTLISIDRPGAVRKFSIESATASKKFYEFLPTDFSIKLKNTGNTIVLPIGEVFIQRSSNSTKPPIAALPLNSANSYMLPDMNRTFSVEWVNGFPSYQTQKVADNVPTKRGLVWDWSEAQNFRFGHYIAKVVAVYNDGQRDVPIYAEIGFWVIPWKLILGGLFVISILLTGVIVIVRRVFRLGNRARSKLAYKHPPEA
jgi:hypothetical protein